MLKDHPHFRTDLLDILDVARQFDAVHDDPAPLMLFQAIDAADQSGFARTGRAADNDPLPLLAT